MGYIEPYSACPQICPLHQNVDEIYRRFKKTCGQFHQHFFARFIRQYPFAKKYEAKMN